MTQLYDKAEWHFNSDFPEELSEEHSGTHIGIFFAWIIMNHLESDFHKEESSELLEKVRSRRMTGREFVFAACGERLTDEDMNEEGNAFARYYYESKDDAHSYLIDYSDSQEDDLPTLYHVEDNWDNFDKVSPLIDRQYQLWKKHVRND